MNFIIGLQHAVGYVSGEEYYGAKASINVWAPQVSSQYEFSLSQMWVISGSFGDDLNTIEAGWQARLLSSNLPHDIQFYFLIIYTYLLGKILYNLTFLFLVSVKQD